MSTEKRGRPAGSQVMPTDNDWRVLQVILRRILADLTDIGNATGTHSLVVRNHVRRLEARGILRRERKPGATPTTFFMPWRMVRTLAYVLDSIVGLNAPWPPRGHFSC